jgi:hypothetical protein
MQAGGIKMEAHAMSPIPSRYAASRCGGLLAVLFSALLALPLFHPSVATAQEVKQIKLFTEPPDQIKKEIASIKANKSIPEVQKREDLTQLEAALKDAKPIQFKENVAMVLKYFDQIPPLKQEEGPAD